MKTEWLPINVFPNCIPPDIQHCHNPFNDTGVNGKRDSEKLVFDRNNPILRSEPGTEGNERVSSMIIRDAIYTTKFKIKSRN